MKRRKEILLNPLQCWWCQEKGPFWSIHHHFQGFYLKWDWAFYLRTKKRCFAFFLCLSRWCCVYTCVTMEKFRSNCGKLYSSFNQIKITFFLDEAQCVIWSHVTSAKLLGLAFISRLLFEKKFQITILRNFIVWTVVVPMSIDASIFHICGNLFCYLLIDSTRICILLHDKRQFLWFCRFIADTRNLEELYLVTSLNIHCAFDLSTVQYFFITNRFGSRFTDLEFGVSLEM